MLGHGLKSDVNKNFNPTSSGLLIRCSTKARHRGPAV